MPRPVFSIVSITYNNAAGLQQTLASIAAQQFRDFEVIVVDGGSRDDTAAVVASFGTLVTHFTSERDRGIAHAFNKGTDRAAGELVNYLNAGDRYFDPGVLALVHARYRERPFAWAYGYSKRSDTEGHIYPPRTRQRLPYSFARLAAGELLVSHQASFFTRELLVELGGYDERFQRQAMDYDLLLRCAARHEPAVIDAPLVVYDETGVSARNNLEGLLAKHASRSRVLRLSAPARALDLARTYAQYAVNRARRAGKRTLLASAAGRSVLRRLGALE